MKRYFEEMKPQERRWFVGGAFVVFLMLNWFFVWPHFHDWGRDIARMDRAQYTNNLYSAEVRRMTEYERKIRELQSDGENDVPEEDQAINFVRLYSTRAVANKVQVINQGALVTRTNDPFFLEQQMGITVQADETNLVDFLYSLGEGNSMISVSAMSLHPDPSHQQLNASITMVASYQKKAPARSGAAAPARTVSPDAVPAVKPAALVAPAAKTVAKTNRIQAISSTNKPGPSITKRP